MKDRITLIQPDDWHCHLRDGAYLKRTVTDTSRQFHRAIVMPNLIQPITTVEQARNYRERILQHVPESSSFSPLMTLYLTEDMTAETIYEAKESGLITAVKLYPAGATTHSASGVSDLSKITHLFKALEDSGLLLLIHGEIPDPAIHPFDREAAFIEQELTQLLSAFPTLKIVLEHISTQTAVEFVKAGPDTLAATITPHHLLLTHDSDPHHHCFPVIKQATDRKALIEAATSGSSKFFLGTDSAPHTRSQKESACGCAGIYSAHAAIELYATIFEAHNALDKLENFASRFGPAFYGLPINTSHITLSKEPWQIPKTLPFGNEELVPLLSNHTLEWKRQA